MFLINTLNITNHQYYSLEMETVITQTSPPIHTAARRISAYWNWCNRTAHVDVSRHLPKAAHEINNRWPRLYAVAPGLFYLPLNTPRSSSFASIKYLFSPEWWRCITNCPLKTGSWRAEAATTPCLSACAPSVKLSVWGEGQNCAD